MKQFIKDNKPPEINSSGLRIPQIGTIPNIFKSGVGDQSSLNTTGVNPASFDNTLLAQGTVDKTGLTQSEQAFLDDEEKAMTLRNRGMA